MKDKLKYKRRKRNEKIIEKVFEFSAAISIFSLILIAIFIFIKGMPFVFEIGFINFVFGRTWEPLSDIFGIFPMILASIYVTIGSVIFAVPIGIFTAVFLSEIAPKHLSNVINIAVELLAAIPSVIYGFFGLLVIVPLIDKNFGKGGNSLLAAIIILGIMILPTIITISKNAINSVPSDYKEGSLALGLSHVETIFKVMIPSAKSGILASVVLALGRAVGETMAVILVIGNTVQIPRSILDRARTLTANIAIEMGYAYGLHQEALFATGVILFVFIMILNLVLNFFISSREY